MKSLQTKFYEALLTPHDVGMPDDGMTQWIGNAIKNNTYTGIEGVKRKSKERLK